MYTRARRMQDKLRWIAQITGRLLNCPTAVKQFYASRAYVIILHTSIHRDRSIDRDVVDNAAHRLVRKWSIAVQHSKNLLCKYWKYVRPLFEIEAGARSRRTVINT
jgi:hypothetical protein